jgi:aryl-alcohol dehydrogenase-like predicted oxidoreductase
MTEATSFAAQDWRSRSEMFSGVEFASDLWAVSELSRIAATELGVSVSRLAIAWTLANPAVHAAIVGMRNAAHVDDAIAAADLELSPDLLARIDAIVRFAAPTDGPAPDSV